MGAHWVPGKEEGVLQPVWGRSWVREGLLDLRGYVV